MNTVKVVNKPLNLTYIHGKGDNRTTVDGTLLFDASNKVSANYILGSSNCKLKYTYVHRGQTTFEPSYDVSKSSWDFALSRKVYDDDVLKATYQTLTKALTLEWSRNSKLNGCFKVCCLSVLHLNCLTLLVTSYGFIFIPPCLFGL